MTRDVKRTCRQKHGGHELERDDANQTDMGRVAARIEGDLAWICIENPPVNAASYAVRSGLLDAVGRVETSGAKIAILHCAGRTFTAGADIREFGQPPREPHLPDVLTAIEGSPVPWCAALHGTVLGGGLELALACSYRIAARGTSFGLPEVRLGLIPGAGGTVRLPRLVAPEDALSMISSGQAISTEHALAIGLIDRIVTGDLDDGAAEFANSVCAQAKPSPLTQRPARDTDSSSWAVATAKARARAKGQNSVGAAVDALDRSLQLEAHEALQQERAAFARLKADPQSVALRHIFFAERSVSKTRHGKGAKPVDVSVVGIVGGGTMGTGIAASGLLAGLEVRLVERDDQAAEAARSRVDRILEDAAERGKLSPQDRDQAARRLSSGADLNALSASDLVIEAVFEDMAVKKETFAQLDNVCRADTVLATNTSYLTVTELARSSKHPERVIGLHFFSPAHVMKLLEVIVPPTAADDVVVTGMALGKRLGKICVPSGVCDGFIGNRIMSRYRREADYLIQDGALPHEVDEAMRAFGFPIGVFQMQDLAGLDIAWAMRKRQAATRPAAQRYVDIADTLCEAGRFGRKSGTGWYDYTGNPKGDMDPKVTTIVEASSAANGISRRTFSQEEIMSRILAAMQSEADDVLAEQIAASSEAIDVVMVNGYGFPRWRGGPMYMRGLEGIP